MKDFPSVTIGIPVYNEERFIAETILSAVNQTYKNIKIIVSDNCSSDNTFGVIEEVIANHPDVKAIRHEKNVGLAANFNNLSKNADTDYFCWLSGHDLIHKDFIAAAVQAFSENPGLSLVYPKSQQIDDMGCSMGLPANNNIDTTACNRIDGTLKVARSLEFGTPVHGLWVASILKEYGFKPFSGSDLTLLHHAALSGKILELPHVYHFMRIRNETASQTNKRYGAFGFKTNANNPNAGMCKEYLRYTVYTRKVNILSKIGLLHELIILFEKKYRYVNNMTRVYALIRRIKSSVRNKFVRTSSPVEL